ncbi:hypothetical protein [Nonomuraea bangladeshensis]|uniref:hypothetical protein n=1 Tax=Nonomuraea bangladeshensis TaxID=404385 RepID=UPI0031DA0CCC
MTITAPPAAAEPPASAQIAENMLNTLRQLAAATDRPLSPDQYDKAADHLTESLAALMYEAAWPRGMALDAIHHALTHGTTLRQAMLACQIG